MFYIWVHEQTTKLKNMKKIFAILFAFIFASICASKGISTDKHGNAIPTIRRNVTFEFDGSMFISILVAGGILMFLHNAIGHWIEHHGRKMITGIKVGEEGQK